MSTLDKILKLEEQIESLKSNPQGVSTDDFNKSMTSIQNNFKVISDKQNYFVERLLALEQTFASLAKMLQAIGTELEDKKVIKSDDVVSRIREMDETAEREQLESMISSGQIQPVEVSDNESIVVTSQTIEDGQGQSSNKVSDFRVFHLSAPIFTEDVVQKLSGLKVGDEVKESLQDGTVLVTKVSAIYKSSVNQQEVQ